MKIRIHGHHVTITDAINQHIQGKFEALAHHDQDITNIEVTLLAENKRVKVDANIHVPGADIFASADDEDMYTAIDQLIPKLDRQIKKHKEKIQDRKRHASA